MVHTITRRDAIKKSVVGFSAFALPCSPFTASAQTAANDTLGVAIIGARTRGGVHAQAFLADPRVEILYIVDVDEQVGRHLTDEVAHQQGRKRHRPTIFADRNVPEPYSVPGATADQGTQSTLQAVAD